MKSLGTQRTLSVHVVSDERQNRQKGLQKARFKVFAVRRKARAKQAKTREGAILLTRKAKAKKAKTREGAKRKLAKRAK